MSSFELNKFLGAILGTCLVVIALNITAGALFAPETPVKPGYKITVEEQPKGGHEPGAAQEQQPFETVLASASPERGANAAKVCGACHTFTKGGPNGPLGPNLYGIVGRPRASAPGFDYSAAMKAKGGPWTLDDLNQFLTKPQAYVPGTAMSFPGYPRANQRADVIAYLNGLSDNPKPLPKAAATQTGPAAAASPPASPAAPAPAAPPPAAGAGAKPNAPAAANAAGKPNAPAPSNPPAAGPGPKPGAPANPDAKPTAPGRTPRP
jgi:cytochrome c